MRIGNVVGRIGPVCACLLAVATCAGCRDANEPQPVADLARPVKTLVVSAPVAGADIELPGVVQAVRPLDLAFEEVSGKIIELPVSLCEGRQVRTGELLAQIDPQRFAADLRRAEDELYESFSALELARAENGRMEKMKAINPDLVSTSMLGRTGKRLEQAEARQRSLEAAVEKAERRLEHSSLRAPFSGIVTRCLVEDLQEVQAGEPILSLQDTSSLEVVVDSSEPLTAAARGPESFSVIARFPAAPGEEFRLQLKEAAPIADPATGMYRAVLKMAKPKEIELPPGTTGTLIVSGAGSGMRAGPVLVPAIAVMTDPDGRDYLWVVNAEELQVHRRDIRMGRLAGSDQVQVLDGLTGGERIVVAGVMALAEGRQVRLWKDREADESR